MRAEIAVPLDLPTGGDYPSVRHIEQPAARLPGPLAVHELAVSSVEAAAHAACLLAEARGFAAPRVEIVDGAVATAFTSERHLRVNGEAGQLWAELSRFFRANDGWVRLHGNYSHHAAAAAAALGTSPDRSAVAAAVGRRRALDVEEAVVAQGGIAAAVRTAGAWQQHPQGSAIAELPLIDITAAAERAEPSERFASPPNGALPAAGLRVLDLTRVIAGPVAGRVLAAWGAEVLRIDPPQLAEIEVQHLDTSWGKRSALLDLRASDGRAVLAELVAKADVVLCGYRPGALAALGAGSDAMHAANPGVITVEVSAWGRAGPWRARRGFDSIVQAACGIADRVADPEGVPGALPAQALDHASGYLAAASAMALLARGSFGARARIALARTAFSLLELGDWQVVEIREGPDPRPWLAETASTYGTLRYVRPPFRVDGRPLDYPGPPGRYGAAAPRW